MTINCILMFFGCDLKIQLSVRIKFMKLEIVIPYFRAAQKGGFREG